MTSHINFNYFCFFIYLIIEIFIDLYVVYTNIDYFEQVYMSSSTSESGTNLLYTVGVLWPR
jgi:hypothetical protein